MRTAQGFCHALRQALLSADCKKALAASFNHHPSAGMVPVENRGPATVWRPHDDMTIICKAEFVERLGQVGLGGVGLGILGEFNLVHGSDFVLVVVLLCDH